MNDHISIPPTAADAYRAMLAEQTYASLEDANIVLSEGNYIISVDNLKKCFKALSSAQNGLDVAIKEYDSIEGHSGHGSGHHQAGVTIEYYRKKVKEHITAMLEIQEGLMEQGEMTKLLQRAFIDELQDNVESLQKQIESRDDNNYVLKSQLSARKAVLVKAKEDLKTLKESYSSFEEDALNEADEADEAEEDEFSFPKDKKQNYAKFLAANAKRVGKPMIDGGLKTERVGNAVNGEIVDDVTYCGDGCITFESKGKKTFIQMNADLLNTSDGSMSWSQFKGFSGDAYISASASKFKEIAKAVALAAKV